MFGKSIIEEIPTLTSYCNGGKIDDGKILYKNLFDSKIRNHIHRWSKEQRNYINILLSKVYYIQYAA